MHEPHSESSGATTSKWAPVLGPVDRTTFAAEQRRRRRDSWRWIALCALAVGLTGIPQSAVITPVVFGFVFALARLAGSPPAMMDAFRELALTAYRSIDYVIDNLDRMPLAEYLRTSDRFVPGFALIFVPGAMVSLLIWLGLQALFVRAGTGGALLALGAREPRADDFEEHQLVNVVHEMAIAAGLPPPHVVLLDVDVPNAVAIGSSPEDATVIVTRRLLDEFNRDETQGMLGHLIGSIGNGDLHVALSIMAVFQTFGLFQTLLEAPYSGRARRTLWRLVGLMWRSILPRRDRSAVQSDLVGAMLTQSLATEDSGDDASAILEAGERPGLNTVHRFLLRARTVLLLPTLLLSLMMKMQQFLFLSLVLGPALAFTWRTRRYLADATAVQLTRNPDGVALALVRLARDGAMIPGAQWASHLLIVGSEAATGRARARFQQEMAGLRERGPGAPAVAQVTGNWAAARSAVFRHAGEVEAAERGSPSGNLALGMTFHPSLDARLRRLAAMGATVPGPSAKPSPLAGRMVLILVGGPLFALCGVLLAVVLGGIFMLALFADEVVVLFALTVIFAVLGISPP